MTKNNSQIIKENNPHFYYALLDFKDRFSDEIFQAFGIETQSLESMNENEIWLISQMMLKKALEETK